jgi:hypothetical protein
MPTSTAYTDFVANVRSWANRDDDVLPDTIIEDALSYAADKAYKKLKIPALEANLTYTIVSDDTVTTDVTQVQLEDNTNNNFTSIVKLPIPADLTFFIHLRIKSSSNNGKQGVVFNEKTDIRTFHDMYADRYTDYFWARQMNYIYASGDLTVGDVIELHYYRRLPALNATYTVNADNFNSGVVKIPTEQASTGIILYFEDGTTYPPLTTDTAYDTQNFSGDREEFYFSEDSGFEVANWLRDENRQILLYGALSHCFDYLNDEVQAAKYNNKFMETILELNQEETNRKASGGNIQMHFNSQLI